MERCSIPYKPSIALHRDPAACGSDTTSPSPLPDDVRNLASNSLIYKASLQSFVLPKLLIL